MSNIIYELEVISEERNSYGTLAKYLLEYDGDYQELRIKKLVSNANVSEAVPTRLAQRLNFEGFKELKYALVSARELKESSTKNRLSYNTQEYVLGMNVYVTEIFGSLDKEVFSKLVNDINENSNIVLFSQGGTATILNQFVKTITRLNKNVRLASNSEELFILSRTLKPDDIVVTFSTTGNSIDVMEAYERSKEVVSSSYLVTSNTSLATMSNTLILKNLNYDANVLTTYSLIGIIAVLDMLIIEVINRNKSVYIEQLNNTRIIK